jgi:hypothetical protein
MGSTGALIDETRANRKRRYKVFRMITKSNEFLRRLFDAAIEAARPASVIDALESGRGESVKPGGPRFAGNEAPLLPTPKTLWNRQHTKQGSV